MNCKSFKRSLTSGPICMCVGTLCPYSVNPDDQLQALCPTRKKHRETGEGEGGKLIVK